MWIEDGVRRRARRRAARQDRTVSAYVRRAVKRDLGILGKEGA